jgi:hypothetical protein
MVKQAKMPKKSSKDEWHVNHSSSGMGDFHGTGIKQKLGIMREGLGQIQPSKKQLNTPPRSLA